MNKQTIEVLEETKTSLNKHFSQWGDTELTINPVLDDVLSTAIKWGKALDQAEKVLPERKEVLGEKEEVFTADDMNRASNEMHDIVKPIIAKLQMENEELKRVGEVDNDSYDSDVLVRQLRTVNYLQAKKLQEKDLRVGFLELTNRAINKELQSLTKENEVLREQNLDAVKDYKELQSLKSKLSRENLENVIDTEGLGIHFEEMGNSIGVYQALRKQLVQAIQKACGINDGGGE